MPRVIDEGGFRLSVWPNDHPPPHVHAFKDSAECLVVIGEPDGGPASLYENRGMKDKDWKAAVELVQKYQAEALVKWRETRADT